MNFSKPNDDKFAPLFKISYTKIILVDINTISQAVSGVCEKTVFLINRCIH